MSMEAVNTQRLFGFGYRYFFIFFFLLVGCAGSKFSTYEHQVATKAKKVPFSISNFQVIDQRAKIDKQGLSSKQFTWRNTKERSAKLRLDQLFTIEAITKSYFDGDGKEEVLVKCLVLEGSENFNFENGVKYYESSWKVSIELLDVENKVLEKSTGRGSCRYEIKQYDINTLDSLQYLSIETAIEQTVRGIK